LDGDVADPLKNREFYEIFKIRSNSFYNFTAQLNRKVFEFAQH